MTDIEEVLSTISVEDRRLRPPEWNAVILHMGKKIAGYAPELDRYVLQTFVEDENSAEQIQAAEYILSRSAWLIVCLNKAGRIKEIDPFFHPSSLRKNID